MGRKSKREYLLAIWGRYQRVGRRFKSKILDEFCEVCDYSRKYAIGLLKRTPSPRRRRPGPRRRYDAAVLAPLKYIWLKAEQMCSKRLKAALPQWLPFYEQKQGSLGEGIRRKLLRISPATIDRLLQKTRARYPAKGLCGTRCGRQLKQQIPIRTDNRDIDRPGFLEADTVAHCGTSMAGSFIWSLTFTDIFSQWTENRAVWNKGATDVLAQVKDLEQGLAFALQGFFQALHAEGGVQAVAQPPADDVAAVPVHHRRKVNVPAPQRNVGDVRAPDLIRTLYGQVPKQIRVDLVLFPWLARPGTPVHGPKPHQAHQSTYPLAVCSLSLTV